MRLRCYVCDAVITDDFQKGDTAPPCIRCLEARVAELEAVE